MFNTNSLYYKGFCENIQINVNISIISLYCKYVHNTQLLNMKYDIL